MKRTLVKNRFKINTNGKLPEVQKPLGPRELPPPNPAVFNVKGGKTPKILIGVPVLMWTQEFAMSFLEFWTDLMTFKSQGYKFHVAYKFTYRRGVHLAEADLAQFAIDTGCTHVLFMDDDIYVNQARDLLVLLNANKDVVGGIMHTGGFPYAMCAFRRFDPKKKVADMPTMDGPARLYEVPPELRVGLQKVDLIPFAFTLMKTSIFKDLKKPWFKCDETTPTDSFFADAVMEKGFEIYACFDVYLNHRGVTRENHPYYFQLGLHEQQRKSSQNNIVMLTADEMRRHEIMMTQKIKDAEKLIADKAKDKIKFYEKNDVKPIGFPIMGPR